MSAESQPLAVESHLFFIPSFRRWIQLDELSHLCQERYILMVPELPDTPEKLQQNYRNGCKYKFKCIYKNGHFLGHLRVKVQNESVDEFSLLPPGGESHGIHFKGKSFNRFSLNSSGISRDTTIVCNLLTSLGFVSQLSQLYTYIDAIYALANAEEQSVRDNISENYVHLISLHVKAEDCALAKASAETNKFKKALKNLNKHYSAALDRISDLNEKVLSHENSCLLKRADRLLKSLNSRREYIDDKIRASEEIVSVHELKGIAQRIHESISAVGKLHDTIRGQERDLAKTLDEISLEHLDMDIVKAIEHNTEESRSHVRNMPFSRESLASQLDMCCSDVYLVKFLRQTILVNETEFNLFCEKFRESMKEPLSQWSVLASKHGDVKSNGAEVDPDSVDDFCSVFIPALGNFFNAKAQVPKKSIYPKFLASFDKDIEFRNLFMPCGAYQFIANAYMNKQTAKKESECSLRGPLVKKGMYRFFWSGVRRKVAYVANVGFDGMGDTKFGDNYNDSFEIPNVISNGLMDVRSNMDGEESESFIACVMCGDIDTIRRINASGRRKHVLSDEVLDFLQLLFETWSYECQCSKSLILPKSGNTSPDKFGNQYKTIKQVNNQYLLPPDKEIHHAETTIFIPSLTWWEFTATQIAGLLMSVGPNGYFAGVGMLFPQETSLNPDCEQVKSPEIINAEILSHLKIIIKNGYKVRDILQNEFCGDLELPNPLYCADSAEFAQQCKYGTNHWKYWSDKYPNIDIVKMICGACGYPDGICTSKCSAYACRQFAEAPASAENQKKALRILEEDIFQAMVKSPCRNSVIDSYLHSQLHDMFAALVSHLGETEFA